MRWKSMVLIVSAALALVLVAMLAAPGQRYAFRANRVLYLDHAHRYQEALTEQDRLQADFPGRAGRLPADFGQRLLKDARDYYHKLDPRGPQQRDYEALLQAAQQRPGLAALARRQRLEMMARRDRASTTTLATARDILKHEGYDAEAIWWATVSQYDPQKPLAIPPELLKWRASVESPAKPGEKPTAEQAARSTYLRALLALADRDWAGAAEAFDLYGRREQAAEPFALAHGLALLRSGRPELSIHLFQQYRRTQPRDPSALAYLAEAQLAMANYPWAAAMLHELRALAPACEAQVLRAVAGPIAPEREPFEALCAELGPGGAHERDTARWSWLDMIATTGAQQRAVQTAAEALMATHPSQGEAQARLLQYCLWHNRTLPAPAPGAALEARRQAVERVAQWYPVRNNGDQKQAPLNTQELRRLLARNQTERFRLKLPQGATLVIVTMQGYPARNVWPIVNLDLGAWGRQVFYAQDSRAQARPFVLALDAPVERDQEVEGAISLLNGSEGGTRTRSVLVADVFVF